MAALQLHQTNADHNMWVEPGMVESPSQGMSSIVYDTRTGVTRHAFRLGGRKLENCHLMLTSLADTLFISSPYLAARAKRT